MKIFDQLWNNSDNPEIFFRVISENRNLLLQKKVYFFNKDDENKNVDEDINLFGKINSISYREKILRLTVLTGKKESLYLLSINIKEYKILLKEDLRKEKYLDIRHLEFPFKNDQLQIYEKDL